MSAEMPEGFHMQPLVLPKLGDKTEKAHAAQNTAEASGSLYRALLATGFSEEQALQLVGMMMRFPA